MYKLILVGSEVFTSARSADELVAALADAASFCASLEIDADEISVINGSDEQADDQQDQWPVEAGCLMAA